MDIPPYFYLHACILSPKLHVLALSFSYYFYQSNMKNGTISKNISVNVSGLL